MRQRLERFVGEAIVIHLGNMQARRSGTTVRVLQFCPGEARVTNEQEQNLKTALRIISRGGQFDPMKVDEDLRDYYTSAESKGTTPLEAAIQVVVDAIARPN